MYLKIYKERVNILLENFVNKIEDNDLKQMVEYSLFGGKRLRSIICLYLLDKFSLKNDNIVIGIEFLHCASLILDDLPAPVAPTNATVSPGDKEKLIPFKT